MDYVEEEKSNKQEIIRKQIQIRLQKLQSYFFVQNAITLFSCENVLMKPNPLNMGEYLVLQKLFVE